MTTRRVYILEGFEGYRCVSHLRVCALGDDVRERVISSTGRRVLKRVM
jgi:hypothetical protein